MNWKPSKNVLWVIIIVIVFVGAFFVMQLNSVGDTIYPEGLQVTVLESGSGDVVENGDTAVVHYTGTLDDGTIFDSSYNRGQPFEFAVGAGEVISGWDLGVLGMKIGEKRKLVIDPELAYGSIQRGLIPPNSRLTFEVELVGIR